MSLQIVLNDKTCTTWNEDDYDRLEIDKKGVYIFDKGGMASFYSVKILKSVLICNDENKNI